MSKDLESSSKCKKRHNETEPLDYYCTDCKVCICDKCGKTRHTHHTKVSIQQATEEEKLKMVELVEQVKIQITEFESKVERMTRLFAISKEKISAARSLAQTTAEELIRALKEHEKCVVNELDVIEKRQERDYATQLESMQASVNELKCSVENCEDILQRDASFETLRAQINDTKKCKRVLKETKLDIYEPCHVHYQLFEEHIRVMKGRSPGELLDSNTDPSRSYVRDNDLKQPEAGRTKDFDIVTIDSEGEQCYHEIDEIKVTVRSPTGIVLDSKTDSWVPRGTYRVRYTPACDGEHEVTVLVNNEPLSGSPWSVSVTPHKYSFFHYFGSPGKARKQFKEPCAVAVDKNKMTIAVADRKEQRVQLYDFCNSEHLTDLGEKGSAAIRLTNPTSVAFTQSGDVIVIASGIMFCFSVSGNFLGCINNKKLKRPFSLSVTSNGRLLVCDSGDKSVKVLSPDGTELLQSFSAPDCDGSPWKAVCHQDMFFASYPEARCVKTFNKDGDFLYDIGKEDAREGHLSQPRGLAVDTFNNLVVCDEEKKTLNVFKLNGTFLNTATENNVLSCPSSIAALSANESPWLIIADSRKKCVIMFD